MYRLIPLCLFLFVLPTVEAVQEKPEAAPEVKAIPTLAPGHHVGAINAMVFTPDGKRLITAGDDKTIQVWDVETGKRVKLFRPPVGPGTAGIINDLALASDGKTLAVASIPRNGEVHHTHAAVLLNLDDGRMIPLDGPGSDSVTSVAFSKDGRRLALAHRQTLRAFSDLGDLWGEMAPKLTSVRLTEKGGDGTQQIAFSPSGDRIVTTSRDSSVRPGQPLIRIWDLKANKLLPATFTTKVPSFSTWSADGEQILTGHGTTSPFILTVWPATGGEPVQTYTAKEVLGEEATGATAAITSIVHHSATNYFLTCSIYRGTTPLTRPVLFDLKTGRGKVVGDVTFKTGRVGAVSPDGRTSATNSAPVGQRIALFDLAETGTRFIGGPAELNNHAGWTATGNSVTWNRRGKDGLVTSGLNLRATEYLPVLREPVLNTVKKRDGVEVVQNKTPGKVGLEIHRGDDRVVLPKVQLSAHFTLPADGPLDWVAIAQLSGFYLHDTKTGERIRTFEPVKQNFTSVSSSPDGKYLFATSERGVMHVYNPAVAKPLLNVYTEDADWIAWTEEGYYAASPTGERLIGWTVNNKDLMREANLLTAEQFRNTLYRPDVIKLLLDKGSVAEALKAANAMRKDVPRGAADPEKLLPPEVSLKVDTTKLPQAIVTVTAKAGCKEQPIKSLRLLVDGRPLPGGVGRVSYDVEKAEASEMWTVEIPPGKHRLSVLARSKDDTPAISSAVLVDSPLPANQRPIVHHVAIGISKYADDKLKLKFAEKDALDLGSAIQKSCTGALYQKVETTSLTNEKAKRDAVLKALDDTRKVAKSTDLLILSFAGHGIRDDGEFYLLTHEADTTQLAKTAISGADLRAKLADYPCQILLMLDACHSGAFAPLAKFKPATDDAARALADVEMRVAVMCAAQGHEEAFEAKDNGHFTAAVIRALQRDPRAFFDLDTGELSVYHLQAFVSQEVSKATDFKQNPYLKMPLAHPPVIVTKFPMK